MVVVLAGHFASFFVFNIYMKFILGKKMPMTQLWLADKKIAVSPVALGPCVITQVKDEKTDGYLALQVATGQRKEKNIKKPQLGHFKSTKVKPSLVREFRLKKAVEVKPGQMIDLSSFTEGERVAVTGISKGKGFQGVVKRHGFAGGNKSHGNKDQLRMPGSIGSMGQARVFKGLRMPGRMGNEQVTVKNLKIVKIDRDNNILFIAGALPGAVNSYLTIRGQGDLKFIEPIETKQEPKKEKETEKPETEKPEIKPSP